MRSEVCEHGSITLSRCAYRLTFRCSTRDRIRCTGKAITDAHDTYPACVREGQPRRSRSSL